MTLAHPVRADELPLEVATVETESTATLSGIVRFSKRVSNTNSFGFETEEGVKPPVDPAARNLASVYLYLEPIEESEPPRKPSTPATIQEFPMANVDQTGFRFRPLVMVVQAGQRVEFTNGDSQDHNVRAYSENDKNTFNIITNLKRSYTKTFQLQRPGSPVKLACDFHPSMRGWIYVVDHNRYAVTSEDGTFNIESIPPGTYQLNIIQPAIRLRTQATIEILPGATLHTDTTFGLAHRYYRAEPKVWVSQKQ